MYAQLLLVGSMVAFILNFFALVEKPFPNQQNEKCIVCFYCFIPIVLIKITLKFAIQFC